MPRGEELDRLIELIHEAALEPSLWAKVMDAVCVATNGAGAHMFTNGASPDAGGIWAGHAMTEANRRAYEAHFGALDPWVGAAMRVEYPNRTVVRGEDLITNNELCHTEFFNDFLKPQGLQRLLSSQFRATGPAGFPLAFLSVFRAVGSNSFGNYDVELMRRLAPHIDLAMRTHRALFGARAESGIRGVMLDALPTAVITCNGDGKPVYMNRTAELILSERDGIMIQRGLLTGMNGYIATQLSTLLRIACPTARGALPRPTVGPLARISGRSPYVVTAVPVASIRESAGLHATAAMILLIHDPDKGSTVPADALRAIYGLTPAEAKLAMRLASGESVTEAADELGITTGTARIELKRVFAKMGARRQSDLVRMIAGIKTVTPDLGN
jgi:DNA-binding CsgD family transcriptional regulator/PAS domain-containing protein